MVEDQVFKSIKVYNPKNKDIIFPDFGLAWVDHQQQIEQVEENKNE